MLYFKDDQDGYYEFHDDAPVEWYEHLIPTEKQELMLEVKYLSPLSAWQVRKVLRQFDMLETVKSAVALSDEETQEAWEYATEFKRDDAVLNAMAQVIGLSDEQLDEMFEVGITL